MRCSKNMKKIGRLSLYHNSFVFIFLQYPTFLGRDRSFRQSAERFYEMRKGPKSAFRRSLAGEWRAHKAQPPARQPSHACLFNQNYRRLPKSRTLNIMHQRVSLSDWARPGLGVWRAARFGNVRARTAGPCVSW